MRYLFRIAIGICLIGPLHAQDSVDASTYPRTFSSDEGTVRLHHPVISDWNEFETLTGRTPMEITLAGSSKTWVGASEFEVDTEILSDRGLVRLVNPRFVGFRFPDDAPSARLESIARKASAAGSDTVVLDFLIRALPEDFRIPGHDGPPPHLNFDPPRIIIANRPTRLLLIDGPPAMSQIRDTDLEIVINSNWEIYQDQDSQRWYILDGEHWLSNTMLAGGDWQRVTELPADLINLQYATDWSHLQSVIPPKPHVGQLLPFAISYEPTETGAGGRRAGIRADRRYRYRGAHQFGQ